MQTNEQWLNDYEENDVDMSKFTGSESKHLKAGDLGGKNPTLEISGVQLVEFDKDEGGKEVKPAISFVGKEKAMVLNATNTEKLCKKFGGDSDGWVGKKVLLGTEFYPKFGKEGLVLTPMDPVGEDFDDEIPF
jgi:hypothetical protein